MLVAPIDFLWGPAGGLHRLILSCNPGPVLSVICNASGCGCALDCMEQSPKKPSCPAKLEA